MHKSSFWDYDMAGRSRSRLAFFFSLSILLFACRNHPTPSEDLPQITQFQSFYHWQTVCQLDSMEQSWLDSLQVDRVYVKFFDLDWEPASASVVPLASVQLDTSGLSGRRVIPTIFITNRSLLQVPFDDLPTLAQQIVEKIDRQFAVLQQPLVELQLDCDWTPNSRNNFFALLQQLQHIYEGRGVVLSVTIRLHQLRYPARTGVPPVSKGVLMFYNMGDLQDWNEPNSILNLEKAAAYLPDDLSYPLHLDLALPLFRWAVLFREGKMIKLINEPNEALLQDRGKFQPLGAGRFVVIQSTYLEGYYLYEGDQLRVESVSPVQLETAFALVQRQFPAATHGLIFYHLDTTVLERYRIGDLRF